MPDEDKTTNTNQSIAGGEPVVDQSDLTTPAVLPNTTSPDISDQIIDPPSPPPMEDGAVSPPPPIVEERKPPEETTASTQETETTEGPQVIPNIPPVITTSGTGGKKPVGKKMIATILGVLVLVGGIGAGVILVQKQQDIREEAAVIDDGGGGGGSACVADDGCIKTGESCCSGKSYRDNSCDSTLDTRCGTKSVPTETSTPTSTPKPPTTIDCSSPPSSGGACTNTSGSFTGRCVIIYCPEGLGADGECHLDDRGSWQKFGSCSNFWNSLEEGQCGQVDTVNESNVYCVVSGKCDSIIVNRTDCSRTPTKPTEPTASPTSAQCLNIKAFDSEWNSITNLSSLVAGDVVRFTVAGSAGSGSFDKARFKINGTLRPDVSVKRTGTNEFYDEYTIPEDVTTFTINAEIHHSSLGWF